MIDDDEQAELDRLHVDVKVAETRLEKEKAEFLLWVQKAEKEMKEAVYFQQRCEHEYAAYTEILKEKQSLEGENPFSPSDIAPGLSVCRRLMAFGSDEDMHEPLAIRARHAGATPARTLRRLLYRDGTSYEGEWDTAAADIILHEAGGQILQHNMQKLEYNKRSLINPSFFACCSGTYDWSALLKNDLLTAHKIE